MLFLTLVLTAAMFIACEPDDNDWVKPNEPNENDDWVKPNVPNVQHSYFAHADTNQLNLFDYYFTDESYSKSNSTLKLKSAMIDTTDIRYIWVTSYYSKDGGQRNIHEIEVWSNGENLAYTHGILGDNTLTCETPDSYYADDELPMFVTDNNYTMYGRWHSLVPADEILRHKVDSFSFVFDQLLTTSDTSLIDDIIANTIYPDTVEFIMDLGQIYPVNSIKLYLGRWTQIFDIEVSENGTDWILLKPDDVNVITVNEITE